jgi:hypothetical protein
MTSSASASAFDAHAPSEGFRLKGEEKLHFVSEMFDRVAPTYDVLNHFISLVGLYKLNSADPELEGCSLKAVA